MSREDPKWLRREGEQLIAKGQALIDRADHIDAMIALGEMPEYRGSVVYHGGVTQVARAMAEAGWTTAKAVSERTGHKTANVSACLSKLTRVGELVMRNTPGYPREYRKAGME